MPHADMSELQDRIPRRRDHLPELRRAVRFRPRAARVRLERNGRRDGGGAAAESRNPVL